MELLTAPLFAIVGAIIVNVLSSEVYAKMHPIASWALRVAVAFLPVELRQARHEEWTAHFLDEQGNLSKLVHALGCVRAALILRDEFERTSDKPFSEKSRTYRLVTQIYFVMDCMVASSVFGAILVYIVPAFLSAAYDWLSGTQMQEKLDRLFDSYLYAFDDVFLKRRGRTRIDTADIFYTPADKR